jgi:hypothetical protein
MIAGNYPDKNYHWAIIFSHKKFEKKPGEKMFKQCNPYGFL